jgi:site-specific DNA recombinase
MNEKQADVVRVALYARNSTDRQEKAGTIESQIAALREHAKAKGYEVIELYADAGYSGGALARPALDKLRDDARRGLFDTVLILSHDRLSRDTFDAMVVKRELAHCGVGIEACNRQNDDSASGELLANIEGGIAQYEKRMIAERTRRGKQHKLGRGGVWRPTAPFGYRCAPPQAGEKDGHLEVIEERRHIVERIFRDYVGGKSTLQIALDLHRDAVPTVRGGRWSDTQVRNILLNPIYSGRPVHGRYTRTETKKPRVAYPRGHSRLETDRQGWVYGECEGIVSVAMQETAIAAIGRHKALSARNAKREYLLTGLLKCHCGHAMNGHTDPRKKNPVRTYVCGRREPNRDGTAYVRCGHRASVAEVDSLVWNHLVDMLTHPEEAMAVYKSGQEEAEARARGAADTLAEVQAKLDRLLTLHLANQLDETTYARQQAMLVEQRQAAQSAVDAYRPEDSWGGIEYAAGAIRERLDCAKRRDIVCLLVRAVTLMDDGTLRVDGHLPAHCQGRRRLCLAQEHTGQLCVQRAEGGLQHAHLL